MEQSKRGGDRSSRKARFAARSNEQKALALWLKGATFEQIAEANFGILTASGAWRAIHRALHRIPRAAADEARQAQLARLQELRLILWSRTRSDPIRAAEALIKLEAREARLLGLDECTRIQAEAGRDGRKSNQLEDSQPTYPRWTDAQLDAALNRLTQREQRLLMDLMARARGVPAAMLDLDTGDEENATEIEAIAERLEVSDGDQTK